MASRSLSRLILALSLGMVVAAVPPAAAAQPAEASREESRCTRQAGKFEPGRAVEPPITLAAEPPTQTVNFGGDRSWKFIDVVLRASRPLPAGFTPSQLDLEVLRRLVRQGDTTTTVASRPLTFTEPRLNPRRDVITFTICVDGQELTAGHYEGVVSAEGPDGVGPVTLTITANAKNRSLFWATVIITGVLVLALLVVRGAATVQTDKAKQVTEAVKDAPAPAGGGGAASAVVSEGVKQQADKVVGANARWRLSKDVLADPLFWVSTFVSAALALAAAFTIYSQNTSWGADPAADAFAVASAVLAAAGLRSLIVTAAGK